MFVGLPICCNKTWLEISTQFTENSEYPSSFFHLTPDLRGSVFVSVCVLRLFPTFCHPILKYFLPSIWRCSSYIKASKKLLIPEIERRRGLRKMSYDQQHTIEDLSKNNLLSWMIEYAQGFEEEPSHLAHLEIVISLASIHTSQMDTVHVLYDLAANPEFIDPNREEILFEASKGWDKTTYSRLRKLDSFMKESQRFNPPSLLSYHRIVTENHVLSNGTRLPKNTHIAMAVNAIQNDPAFIENLEQFDGLHYYNMRQQPGHGHLHQFVTTEPIMLNFGHGKHACPGRFFAALEIKSILVMLLMNYDFKLLPGQGRPVNLTTHEFIFPNPRGKLLVKEREQQKLAF